MQSHNVRGVAVTGRGHTGWSPGGRTGVGVHPPTTSALPLISHCGSWSRPLPLGLSLSFWASAPAGRRKDLPTWSPALRGSHSVNFYFHYVFKHLLGKAIKYNQLYQNYRFPPTCHLPSTHSASPRHQQLATGPSHSNEFCTWP